MHRSTAASSHAGTGLRRRGWLWVCGGLCTAGVMGALATHRRWWPGAAAVPEIEPEVCVVAPPLPHDPASGLALHAPRPVPADARCPVCGMFPARQPLWAGQAVYRDGAAHFFDSPVDLMQFLTAVERYSAGRSAADVHTSWVTDAAGRGWVELTKAWFVHGSDALGPMRRGDLPAFADEAGAAEFAGRRGGRVLAFEAVTPAILKSLAVERGAGLHEHGHAS